MGTPKLLAYPSDTNCAMALLCPVHATGTPSIQLEYCSESHCKAENACGVNSYWRLVAVPAAMLPTPTRSPSRTRAGPGVQVVRRLAAASNLNFNLNLKLNPGPGRHGHSGWHLNAAVESLTGRVWLAACQ